MDGRDGGRDRCGPVDRCKEHDLQKTRQTLLTDEQTRAGMLALEKAGSIFLLGLAASSMASSTSSAARTRWPVACACWPRRRGARRSRIWLLLGGLFGSGSAAGLPALAGEYQPFGSKGEILSTRWPPRCTASPSVCRFWRSASALCCSRGSSSPRKSRSRTATTGAPPRLSARPSRPTSPMRFEDLNPEAAQDDWPRRWASAWRGASGRHV